MQTTCVTNRSGYEQYLKVGQQYDVVDIQLGIFAGDYYISVEVGNKTVTALRHRFDITKEYAQQYIDLKDLITA